MLPRASVIAVLLTAAIPGGPRAQDTQEPQLDGYVTCAGTPADFDVTGSGLPV